ncbi:MAG: 16S rRNA (adenine(1518)-N(6)/adenine(1519)-N(6))-dimethyltransferase RsmA [Mariprofundaceae bacterium]|nr:16S rRNA (adenine(1518)-N(6)/adenine(1519)-N(6))-dimethyltransferase RsmA [Mariprofundaceae bacterium]
MSEFTNYSVKRSRAKKSLGQHFLLDRNAIARITEAIPQGAQVLEIGPGRGAITDALLKRAQRLILIEKDDALVAEWQAKARAIASLSVIHGDALELIAQAVSTYQPQWIVGNLPYNISGPLSAALFACQLSGGMVLMYQREVGERIRADAGSKTYGGLSVLARHFYDVQRLLSLPPGAFSPPPKVHSAVLLFTPHGRTPVCEYSMLQKTVRQGFAHRRKTIANNFRGVLDAADWQRLEINAGLRPEQLDYAVWARLARFLSEKN